MGERIQKVLSHVGVGARRQIEAMIKAGQITVNGELAQLGQQLQSGDVVQVAGKTINWQSINNQPLLFLMLHKPLGVVCSQRATAHHPSVFSLLPPCRYGRWVAVGRLDVNSSGLLLFTNQGEWAYRLMHPRYELIREYHVRVLGEVTANMLKQIATGIMDNGELLRAQQVVWQSGKGANQWYRMQLTQGRYREVRRLWEYFGLQVAKLVRVRYGSVILPADLPAGGSVMLSSQQVNSLGRCIGC